MFADVGVDLKVKNGKEGRIAIKVTFICGNDCVEISK
jgi:hypothetical protein